jgi:hypothetical protein
LACGNSSNPAYGGFGPQDEDAGSPVDGGPTTFMDAASTDAGSDAGEDAAVEAASEGGTEVDAGAPVDGSADGGDGS